MRNEDEDEPEDPNSDSDSDLDKTGVSTEADSQSSIDLGSDEGTLDEEKVEPSLRAGNEVEGDGTNHNLQNTEKAEIIKIKCKIQLQLLLGALTISVRVSVLFLLK